MRYPIVAALAAAGGVMAASAFVNWRLVKKAQRDNPLQGQFVDIDGVRLYYVERAAGRPLVFQKAMAVRPSQSRASAAEAAMMIPAAYHSSKSHSQIAQRAAAELL